MGSDVGLKLSDVADLKGGFAFKSGDYSPKGHFILRTVNIRSDGRITKEGAVFIPDSLVPEYERFQLQDQDTLFVMVGATLGKVGYVTDADLPALLNQNMWVIRSKDPDRAEPRYLNYWFQHVVGETLAWASGSARGFVRRDDYRNLDFPNVSLPEQKAIAHILGTLDDKIELNRRMNATLEGMAQALFKSWFVDFDPVIDNALAAGNPIPDELAPRAEVRKKALANGTANREAAKAFPDAFQETESMGWIPEGWEVVRFDELVSAKQGRYLAKTDMVETADSVFKYPVWGGNGILGFSSNYAYDEPITLMTCRGSNCGLIKFTESSAWISNNSFACPTKYGSQYFLYLYFRNESFEECVSGSAQPQITYTALKNKVMKFPISEPICEQFSNLVQSYKDRQAQNASQNETLIKLRDTLLPKLISGELRLSEAEQLTEEAST